MGTDRVFKGQLGRQRGSGVNHTKKLLQRCQPFLRAGTPGDVRGGGPEASRKPSPPCEWAPCTALGREADASPFQRVGWRPGYSLPLRVTADLEKLRPQW